MAILSSSQSGNFTTASTWSVVDPVSYSALETGSTAVGTTFTSSAAFTPGAITIDGVGIRILQTQTTPVGTFSARLIQGATPVTGTTVTINVADIPNGTLSIGGWVFFKFAAPVTLAAATAYNVQIACSSNGNVTAYRGATANEWSRFLRTTTVSTGPAASDTLIVNGEFTGAGTNATVTVTMDNTANTTFGSLEVSAKGTLTYQTNTATNYLFKSNQICRVTGAGTLEIGTLATPIPASSTATFNFVNSTNVDFGLDLRGKCFFTTYGASKIGRAYLNADAASLATSITTDVSTSWTTGDSIAIASTTTTVNQTEAVTLTGNASGTTVPISTISFAHSGTNPTRAEIINLTRNVKISGTSISLQSYISTTAFVTLSCSYTEFQFMGSATANKRGIDVATQGTGSATFIGCAFKNFEVASSIGISLGTSVANVILTDCVFYRMNAQAVNFSSSALASVVLTDCWAFTNLLAGNGIFAYSSPLPTLNGIVAVSSATGFGISFSTNDLVSNVISNLTTHSNGAGGISFTINSPNSTPPTISNINSWKNVNRNIQLNNANNILFDTITTFGASIANFEFVTTPSSDLTFKTVSCYGGTSPTTSEGIRFSISCDKISFIDTVLGSPVTHAIADIGISFTKGFLGCNFYNSQFLSATEVSNLTAISYNSYIASSKHEGVSGDFKVFTPLGNITKDYVIYDTATLGLSASTRLTPTSTASKLTSEKTIIVPNGKQLRVTVGVRTSVIGDGAAYNGNLPTLVLKKNHSLGILNDTVLSTATVASSGAFEFITGVTPTATDDGALTFCATCDGTTGFINTDSWKVEVI